jgi:alkylhydroperoxidase family enzyme
MSSWVPGAASDRLEDLLALRGDLAALIREAESSASAAVPGRLRTLCRIRAAQLAGDDALLQDEDVELVRAVRSWTNDTSLTEGERAVLAVCEQFVIDAHGLSDADIAGLQQFLSAEEVVGLFANLALIDGFTKFHRVMTAGGS